MIACLWTCQQIDICLRVKAAAKNADRADMMKMAKTALFFSVLSVLSFSAPVIAASSGTLRLSGQVDPQLNVTATLDWTHWVLRLDNASNVENETYWINVGTDQKIRLDRTAMVDLAGWVGRNPSLQGKQFQVTIASP